jgi:hypothetical protein
VGLSKTFNTFFFPVDEEVREIVAEWVSYLRDEKLWGNDDPLFPATRITLGPDHQFGVAGLAREHWSTASPIRTIFCEAFVSAGLPYFNRIVLKYPCPGRPECLYDTRTF